MGMFIRVILIIYPCIMRMEIRDKIFGFCECFLLILRKTIFQHGRFVYNGNRTCGL